VAIPDGGLDTAAKNTSHLFRQTVPPQNRFCGFGKASGSALREFAVPRSTLQPNEVAAKRLFR
jgi:hypothetical protein